MDRLADSVISTSDSPKRAERWDINMSHPGHNSFSPSLSHLDNGLHTLQLSVDDLAVEPNLTPDLSDYDLPTQSGLSETLLALFSDQQAYLNRATVTVFLNPKSKEKAPKTKKPTPKAKKPKSKAKKPTLMEDSTPRTSQVGTGSKSAGESSDLQTPVLKSKRDHLSSRVCVPTPKQGGN